MTADQQTWAPSPEAIERSALAGFVRWLRTERGLDFGTYAQLWSWSTADPDAFWQAIADFFDVPFHDRADRALAEERMPGAVWFPGATLNYAECALRRTGDGTAVVALSESGRAELTWDELREQVGSVAAWMRAQGVNPGDRVVGYVPHIAPAVVCFLAAASLGAIWSMCSQEFSAQGAADRLAQLEPVLLVTADGYDYNGSTHRRDAEVAQLLDLLPSVTATLWVTNLGGPAGAGATAYDAVIAEPHPLEPTPVPFDHPLWVLYSSGTTGRPKGIVHGHGGIVLEHLKMLGLHMDIGACSRFFWFTTTSWMMWNMQVSGLLLGATIVLYDGSPGWPRPDALWDLAAREELTFLGTSAAYLVATHKSGARPGKGRDLSRLESLGSTGSPLPESTHAWIKEALPHVWVGPASGGTDIASGFAGVVPTEPSRAGEMQARQLGVAMEAWDPEGRPVVDEVGELVVTRPLPSMPLYFWDDPDNARYLDAYFSTYPGVWRHGDWVTVSDHGSVTVHGRSDATMNRLGVRMGSAEIYEVVDQVAAVRDCLVVGVELADGGYWMPLFVVPSETGGGTSELAAELKQLIRAEVSPRHVPDEVIFTSALPHTMTGKRMEVPVKRLLQGVPLDQAVNPSAVDDPGALDQFVALAREGRG